MIGFAQTQKDVTFVTPQSVATNATETGAVVDTLGWDYMSVVFAFDSAATVSNIPLGVALWHSADATTFTVVTALQGGVGWTLPTAVVSSAAYHIRMNVPLDGYARYWHADVTPGTAAQIVYVGGRLEQRDTAGDNTAASVLGDLNVVYG